MILHPSSIRAACFSLLALTAFALAPQADGQALLELTNLHTFPGANPRDGIAPAAGLIQGSDGAFYGTTGYGGTSARGTVFRLSADKQTYTTLHIFVGGDNEGELPMAALLQGSDGAFYGTTFRGGPNNLGSVFRVSADGQTFTTLHLFTGLNDSGTNTSASLIQGSDGALYGTTITNGSKTNGTIFRLTTDGQTFTTVHRFNPAIGEGASPYAGLILGSDGAFYGTTAYGGTSGVGNGTVFRLSANGQTLTTLHVFTGSDGEGARSFAPLILGDDGAFYGTTEQGGTGAGTVFRLSADGQSFATLHSFTSADGSGFFPEAALLQGSDGAFYGTTVSGGTDSNGTIYRLTQDGSAFTIVHRFTGSEGDGLEPVGALIQDGNGSFYGVTQGNQSAEPAGTYGLGTIFELDQLQPPVITSPTSATATTGQAFTYQITATHSPTGFTTSSIPPGLSFNTSTGLFTGTPTSAATYKPLLTAINAAGKNSVNLNLVVKLAPPVITSATDATATVGKAFSYQITATNKPTSYATSSVPPGLSFDKTTGKFTGTPTTVGTYKPLIAAINSAGNSKVNLNLVVRQGAPVVTSALTADAQVAVAFSYQITATNSPTSYGASGLLDGLKIDQATGQITGTPTKDGTFAVTIAAFNSAGSGTAKVTLTVKPLAKPVITSALTVTATADTPFSYQITATNHPTRFGASGIPARFRIDQSTGVISGTERQSGSFTVIIAASNSAGTGTATLALTVQVAAAPPVITSGLNPPSRVGSTFVYQITATNNPGMYGASGLPDGLVIDQATGRIHGAPKTAGTYNVVIAAFNSAGAGTATLNLVVKPPL